MNRLERDQKRKLDFMVERVQAVRDAAAPPVPPRFSSGTTSVVTEVPSSEPYHNAVGSGALRGGGPRDITETERIFEVAGEWERATSPWNGPECDPQIAKDRALAEAIVDSMRGDGGPDAFGGRGADNRGRSGGYPGCGYPWDQGPGAAAAPDRAVQPMPPSKTAPSLDGTGARK
jgi:hypothetical protein